MFLTTNVLQGKMNERGNFETKLKSADPDKETWEVPKKQSEKGMCCGGDDSGEERVLEMRLFSK